MKKLLPFCIGLFLVSTNSTAQSIRYHSLKCCIQPNECVEKECDGIEESSGVLKCWTRNYTGERNVVMYCSPSTPAIAQ